MTRAEIHDCLCDLQVVATVPRLSEEQITELVKRKLIQRIPQSGDIRLTELGVHTKTGQV